MNTYLLIKYYLANTLYSILRVKFFYEIKQNCRISFRSDDINNRFLSTFRYLSGYPKLLFKCLPIMTPGPITIVSWTALYKSRPSSLTLHPHLKDFSRASFVDRLHFPLTFRGLVCTVRCHYCHHSLWQLRIKNTSLSIRLGFPTRLQMMQRL